MEYKPWGWLIGTGVYLEDIRNEIAGMKRIFIIASLAIFALMTALLTIIVRRNLRVETQRSIAEQNLKESRERYRTLVEASNDGTLLFMDGKCIYANKKIKDMLSDTQPDSLSSDLSEIIHPDRKDDIQQIREFQTNNKSLLQIETILSVAANEHHEALITISQVTLSENNGFIYVIKDLVRSKSEETDSALAQLGPAVSESRSVGVFSATLRGKGRFTAFSPALPALLGYATIEDLKKISILDLIDNNTERREFASYLARHRRLDGYQLKIRKPAGGSVPVLIYATLVSDEITGAERISGIFTDISSIIAQNDVNLKTIQSVNLCQSILNSNVSRFIQKPVFCSEDSTLDAVVGLMQFYSTVFVLVQNKSGVVCGYISTKEIFKSIEEKGIFTELKASEVMNSTIQWIAGTSSVAVAISFLDTANSGFLAIKGNEKQVPGIFTMESVSGVFDACFPSQLRQIKGISSINQMVDWCRQLPFGVKMLLDNGAKAPVITNLVTSHSDQVTALLIIKVLEEIGPAPVRFAFIALGSEARKEQTLLTDQDNALIYDDSAAGNQEVSSYFLKFGKRMNELLHTAGYELCKGGIMAGNPRWNQPLSSWKKYFASWIAEANPQNIVDISVFFDYRTIYGDNSLTNDLRETITALLYNTPAFFGFMALANLNYKLPLNIFGRLQTDSSEENTGTINIKNASRVLVNITRLYAMKNNIEETNTLGRIHHLYNLNILPHQLYTDLQYCYEFLLLTQFRHQVFAASNRLQMDHNINLSMLSSIEINTLKTIFSTLSTFQNRLKNDFGVNI
jgi:PAS domain S-box-containing protein